MKTKEVVRPEGLYTIPFFLDFLKNISLLFIYLFSLHRVLVAARRDLRCVM